MGDPNIERVTVMKSARVGYTCSVMATLGSLAANTPCSVILLVPTLDDAKKMAIDNVDPTFQESPTLANLMKFGRLDGKNTLTLKSFPGGSLKILAAKAPRNLRAHDAKVLLVDEVDAMTVTSEGDPVALAERRTMAHPDRRIICGSTPTTKGLSRIELLYGESDQRVYECPCPECNEYVELLWEHIRWMEGHPEDAEWCCPLCGCMVSEKHKFDMVENGRWRVTKPEVDGHAGFRLNALVSLLPKAKWGVLAKEYEVASNEGPAKLRPFYNTALGMPYEEYVGAASTPTALFARKEDYGPENIPGDVLLLTASVDVQADRFEMQIWGWGIGDQVWVIDNRVIPDDPTDVRSWERLDAVLDRKFIHPVAQREVRIESVTIDTGFLTQMGYDFCLNAQAAYKPYFPTKGMPGTGKPIWKESEQKFKRGGKLYLVGVDDAKTILYQRLAVPQPGPSYIHFPAHLELSYFKQLVSETVKTEYVAGIPKRDWYLPAGKRNEALDTAVGNMAARFRMRIDYEMRQASLAVTASDPKKVGETAASIARMF